MNEEEVYNKIQSIETNIYGNESCLMKLRKQIEDLIVNEIGIISFVLGDEENEWKQLLYKIIHTDFAETERNLFEKIKRQTIQNEAVKVTEGDVTMEENDDEVFFDDDEIKIKEQRKQQQLEKIISREFEPCRLFYVAIDSSILKNQKDLFLFIKTQLEQQHFPYEDLKSMPNQFTPFINWIKRMRLFRVILIISNTSNFLKNNIELFYEITDSFLTLLDNNHVTVIFTALSDDIFADKKITSRITFGRDPFVLKNCSSIKEMKSFLIEMASIQNNTNWNTFVQTVFDDKNVNELFQMNININPLRIVAVELIRQNIDQLMTSDNQFKPIDMMKILYPQIQWSITPYQYVMLIGLNRMSQMSASPIISVGDLCDFLFKNTKDIKLLKDVKQSFFSLKDYHYQILLELQTLGLVNVNVKSSTVSLEITQLTIEEINKCVDSNPIFKELITWNKSLNLVFQK